MTTILMISGIVSQVVSSDILISLGPIPEKLKL